MKLRCSTLAFLAMLLAPAGQVFAQKVPPPARVQPKKPQNKEQKQIREIERFERMTPEQRRRALDRLPPERRARIEERFGRLQQMTPKERQNLRRRLEEFDRLPDDRKPVVRQELRRLRLLSPEDRQKRLQSPQLKKRFNEDELRLLDGVSASSGPPAL